MLDLCCAIKVITVLGTSGEVGLDPERSVYCLAKLRPKHHFKQEGKVSVTGKDVALLQRV